MAERFDLIVFDWDGTLMDSVPPSCVRCGPRRDLDLPVPSEERARYVIGLGLGDALRHAVADLEVQPPRGRALSSPPPVLGSPELEGTSSRASTLIDALAGRDHLRWRSPPAAAWV